MTSRTDFVIVGAGPAGLAFAQVVATQGFSVRVLDREQVIGGCHRVRRKNGAFTEHGPRVYGNQYKTFQMLLDQMNVPFKSLFTEYKFNLLGFMQQTLFKTLDFKELLTFFIAFCTFLVLPKYGIDEPMASFMARHQFSLKTRDVVERLCVMTDGATTKTYTLYAFLQLLNQNAFYQLYQPKLPNDQGLFPIWQAFLKKQRVSFTLGVEVVSVHADHVVYTETDQDATVSDLVSTRKSAAFGKNIILAVPPKALFHMMKLSPRRDLFGPYDDLKAWAERTAYLDYQCYSLHYTVKLNLKETYSFIRSEWGIICLVLSDYMSVPGTLLSCAITFPDRISSKLKKTARQATPDEIKQEILYVLRESYGPNVSEPDQFLSGSSEYDTAFVGFEFMPAQSPVYKTVFTLGTHNGASQYAFTTMETAVQNAVVLANTFVSKKWPVSGLVELRHAIYLLIGIMLAYMLW